MWHYLKNYPVSAIVILAVVYLSFFRPPSLEIGQIPYMDKAAHFCMYGGLSGMLWFEFLRNHLRGLVVWWHAWIGAVLCPAAMSGIIELLQGYCTTYRGGDWLDFVANLTGVFSATLFARLVLQPYMVRKKGERKC